jgi:hypothetical protein
MWVIRPKWLACRMKPRYDRNVRLVLLGDGSAVGDASPPARLLDFHRVVDVALFPPAPKAVASNHPFAAKPSVNIPRAWCRVETKNCTMACRAPSGWRKPVLCDRLVERLDVAV